MTAFENLYEYINKHKLPHHSISTLPIQEDNNGSKYKSFLFLNTRTKKSKLVMCFIEQDPSTINFSPSSYSNSITEHKEIFNDLIHLTEA